MFFVSAVKLNLTIFLSSSSTIASFDDDDDTKKDFLRVASPLSRGVDVLSGGGGGGD